jgi:hypothetical protein
MKLRKGLSIHTVGSENIIVSDSDENVDFTNIISLNESAVRLWKEVSDKEFSVETLSSLLLGWYDVDTETALADARELAEKWSKAGLTEE